MGNGVARQGEEQGAQENNKDKNNKIMKTSDLIKIKLIVNILTCRFCECSPLLRKRAQKIKFEMF